MSAAAEEGRERERERRRIRHLEGLLEKFGGEDGKGGPQAVELGKRIHRLEGQLENSLKQVMSLQEALKGCVPPERAVDVLAASLRSARAVIPLAEEAAAREAGLKAQVRKSDERRVR